MGYQLSFEPLKFYFIYLIDIYVFLVIQMTFPCLGSFLL